MCFDGIIFCSFWSVQKHQAISEYSIMRDQKSGERDRAVFSSSSKDHTTFVYAAKSTGNPLSQHLRETFASSQLCLSVLFCISLQIKLQCLKPAFAYSQLTFTVLRYLSILQCKVYGNKKKESEVERTTKMILIMRMWTIFTLIMVVVMMMMMNYFIRMIILMILIMRMKTIITLIMVMRMMMMMMKRRMVMVMMKRRMIMVMMRRKKNCLHKHEHYQHCITDNNICFIMFHYFKNKNELDFKNGRKKLANFTLCISESIRG